MDLQVGSHLFGHLFEFVAVARRQDDLADACLFLMEHYDGEQLVNVGWGEDVSIKELAELIGSVVGYSGQLIFDTSKPDGTPRKLLDVSKLQKLGWRAETPLKAGIESTYAWFL